MSYYMIGPWGFSSNDRSIKHFLVFDKQPMTCRNYVQLVVMKSFYKNFLAKHSLFLHLFGIRKSRLLLLKLISEFLKYVIIARGHPLYLISCIWPKVLRCTKYQYLLAIYKNVLFIPISCTIIYVKGFRRQSVQVV